MIGVAAFFMSQNLNDVNLIRFCYEIDMYVTPNTIEVHEDYWRPMNPCLVVKVSLFHTYM